ncbi:hypothetical protein WKC13_004661 [Escherichia coli]|uniref:hypothetical protein n=1 Tax=Escherichia coli TaxID=562 RepID=UPI000AF9F10B|nr:hypothetical protein [Escherichia coli]HBC2957418.1 hypothetical protein [Escherichia coli O146]HDQ6611297.1 hypothetical protein [Escherichia coli Ou:H21]HDQ6953126.1 hypothetical protein [Escherichia coli Ou:H8]EEC8802969.1 hypothetical protein [Escherichia coli]EED0554209.1 hypothetical protein [Escherichia coli]
MDTSLMLKNIKYAGFDIVSSSFRDNTSDDGGFFKVSIEELKFASGRDDDGTSWFRIGFSPSIKGYPDREGEPVGDEEPSFELKMELITDFDIINGGAIDEKFFVENSWYFENFMSLTLKLAVDSVLKHTSLSDIYFPWYVPGSA